MGACAYVCVSVCVCVPACGARLTTLFCITLLNTVRTMNVEFVTCTKCHNKVEINGGLGKIFILFFYLFGHFNLTRDIKT